ncbi:EAL domain-containing protein [Aquihabitans sp. G128]|uniref:EAL domain-containing protein n=1 Tax=Aquihabitans sp. G128 TaxID=2849779 RepID=UPI0020B42FD4|nr:EAL domain-containing protein [Aquihabitans sp. G128]
MDELGDLILQTACAAAAHWRDQLPDLPIQLAVNVSGRQLDDPTLPSRVAAALDASGLDAASLWLEITESVLMRNPTRSTALLAELKARGVRLAADDFGTGYSSLAYLKTFPLDALKIDRSFVSAMPTGPQEVAITRAVIAVADALGLEVIAEGIERGDQRDCVTALGAALGQGYLWSPAVTADAFAARLSAEDDGASVWSEPEPTSSGTRLEPGPGSEASADERVDALLEELAHEIRSPLAVVSGYAGLIQTSDLAEARIGGAAIQRAAHRIDAIVGQVTGVGRRIGRSDPAARQPVDLGALVDGIVADFGLITSGELRWVEPAGPAISVSADATQIERAITNLISNAVRFGPRGAPVVVALQADNVWADVEISDEGPGVDPADLSLLFCKYGRADRAGPGSGLGLYLARRIARAHGGDILVRPRTVGRGSTFTVRLPVVADRAPQARSRPPRSG